MFVSQLIYYKNIGLQSAYLVQKYRYQISLFQEIRYKLLKQAPIYYCFIKEETPHRKNEVQILKSNLFQTSTTLQLRVYEGLNC